jgi:hypothetical protein
MRVRSYRSVYHPRIAGCNLPDKRAPADKSHVIDAAIAFARVQNWTVGVRVGNPRFGLHLEQLGKAKDS